MPWKKFCRSLCDSLAHLIEAFLGRNLIISSDLLRNSPAILSSSWLLIRILPYGSSKVRGLDGLNHDKHADVTLDLQAQYNNHKTALQTLAQKVGEIEQEIEEHKYATIPLKSRSLLALQTIRI